MILHRNSLGRNDNPNTVEFRSAFRKLLICHPIITSVGHNVITNATGILTVSTSRSRAKIPISPITQEIEVEIPYEDLMISEIGDMDAYDQHMAAYIALCVEEKILKNIRLNKYKCPECAQDLLSSAEKINDSLLEMKMNAKQPSESTLKIIVFSNAVMKIISSHREQGNDFDTVWKTIFNNIDIDDLFLYSKFETHKQVTENISKEYSHKEQFIIEIIKTYMALKSEKIGSKITDEERGELIRQRRKNAIHKAGQ